MTAEPFFLLLTQNEFINIRALPNENLRNGKLPISTAKKDISLQRHHTNFMSSNKLHVNTARR
jgi:hypothetical protein